MQTAASFRPLALPRELLRGILADYLALDRARTVRRRLVLRLGLLALAADVAGSRLHGLTSSARYAAIGLVLVPAGWAWLAELRLELRLSRRLDGVAGDTVVPPGSEAACGGVKKS